MKSCPNEENLQAYLDGELAASMSDAVRAHLAACSHCAMAVQEMEEAFAVLGSVVAAELPDAIPTARLRARIESALAEKALPKFAWAQLFWRFGWVAAALLVAGVVGWTLLGTRSVTQPQQARTETPVPPVPAELQPTPLLAQMPEHPHTQRRVRQRTGNAKTEEAEVVTQFFPLREGVDLTALGSEQLLRVELPGSALSEAGFMVDFETAQTSVKADVVLGQDGLARAIRFVR